MGSINGQVVTWSDSQIVAKVAPGSLSGIVQVTQNAVQSNSKSFIVPGPGGSILSLTPDPLRMLVGDTHTIQALNPSNQPVTGLTWASSDPTIVSLSTDDPPVLTAVAAGHVTITAGSASADVTVSSVALAPGTVLWSNAVGGGTVDYIVPAVPSPTGVADVFATSGNTLYAITSDGTTAWTADTSDFDYAFPVPDFQGGVLLVEEGSGPPKIVKLDGITGRRYPAYMPAAQQLVMPAAHPDGTVFAVEQWNANHQSDVVGIDPITGTLKFRASIPEPPGGAFSLIIAGDGNAYVPYWAYVQQGQPDRSLDVWERLGVFQVSSSGASNDMSLQNWYFSVPWDPNCFCTPTPRSYSQPSVITNADSGAVVLWDSYSGWDWAPQMAVITGGSVSVTNGPQVPHFTSSPARFWDLLQAQDGSFIGATVDDSATTYMFNFDTAGNVRWVVPNADPQIATADGGVVATDTRSGAAVSFDQYGNATGQMASLPVQSWTGELYQYGSVDDLAGSPEPYAVSWSAFQGGNQSGNGAAAFRRDSKANNKVKGILSKATWQSFAKSTCGSVLGNSQGIPSMIPNYSLQVAQAKQAMTNFYDVGNTGIGNLTLREVTGGQYGSNVLLTDYLANAGANAATANLGYSRQTAVILQSTVLSQAHPEFTLMHEVILHAYAAQSDDVIFLNASFQKNGLWRAAGSKATINISTWMSTDCTCTPGNPATPACQANTAKW